MSNMTVFNGAKPPTAFANLDPQSESLADGIGSSFGVIHYTGKTWSLRIRGETYRFNRTDDGTPAPYLDVIILRQLPVKSKTYYPKGAYESGERGPPLCSSIDGVRPDAGVKAAQATACAICSRNEWKTSPDGRKGRDCADNKRLAVLILPNLTKVAMGNALMEPVFLRVPPASLNALSKLGEDMGAQGWHYSTYVTRIGFVAEEPHPKLTFTALQALTEAEAPVVLPMREDPMSYRITGENDIGKERPAAIVTEPPPVKYDMAPQKKAAPTIDVVPDKVDTGFASVPKATVLPPVSIGMTMSGGEVEESNPDIDARIAGLLKTS